jgi:pimeloyl-ACP methyl ester carboxylesterase
VIDESLMLDVNGLRIHVTSTGQGPTVLLLHGFPDTHQVWRKQVGLLAAAGYRVLAPDLRGYGRSDAPAGIQNYTLDQLRSDMLGVLDALHIDKVFLVGHDWGSLIAWQMATLVPQRIHRLVTLSVGHPAAISHSGLLQHLRLTYVFGFILPGIAEHTPCVRATGS